MSKPPSESNRSQRNIPVVEADEVFHPQEQTWHPHPQQQRPMQRYASFATPPLHDAQNSHIRREHTMAHSNTDHEAGWIDPSHQPQTNVSVNNNGNFYRPWKEELALSLGRTVGNFFAFPIRLIGKIFEGIVAAGISLLKLILLAVIAPTLIYTGMQMYQARQAGEPIAAAAADVGKEAIGLVGAVLGGMWNGAFGE